MKLLKMVALLLLPLLLFVGCRETESIDSESESMGSSESVAAPFQTIGVWNVPLLTEEELAALTESRAVRSPEEMGVTLFFDGSPIPVLATRKTYYLTVDKTAEEWGKGILSAYTTASLAFSEADMAKGLSYWMENNKACTLYAYTDQAYTELELIFTTMPIIQIDTDGAVINREEQDCYLTLFEPRAGETAANSVASAATIRYRGKSSANLPKKSYRIELQKPNGSDTRKESLLGMRKDDDWILYPAYTDEAKIRDAVAWELWRQMASYTETPSGGAIQMRYTEVLLDGKYHGMFILMERFDEKTLNLSEGSYLFKSNEWETMPSQTIRKQPANSEACGGIEKIYPDPEDNVAGGWDVIATLVQLTFESDSTVFARHIDDYVDRESILDYWIYLQVIMGLDNLWKNTYFAVIDGKIQAFPWDMDVSFGLGWAGDKKNYLYQAPEFATTIFEFKTGRRLIQYCPGAADYVKARWQELRDSGVISHENIMKLAETYWSELHDSGAFIRDKRRWLEANRVEDLTYFREIMAERIAFLDAYIDGLSDAGAKAS